MAVGKGVGYSENNPDHTPNPLDVDARSYADVGGAAQSGVIRTAGVDNLGPDVSDAFVESTDPEEIVTTTTAEDPQAEAERVASGDFDPEAPGDPGPDEPKGGRPREDAEGGGEGEGDERTVEQLRDEARGRGLHGYSRMSKDELLEALRDDDKQQ